MRVDWELLVVVDDVVNQEAYTTAAINSIVDRGIICISFNISIGCGLVSFLVSPSNEFVVHLDKDSGGNGSSSLYLDK